MYDYTGGGSATSLSDALASFKAAERATAPAATGYDALSDAALAKEVASLQAMQKQSPGNWRVGEELSMAKLAQDNRQSTTYTATNDNTTVTTPFDTGTSEPDVSGSDGKILGENNTTVDNNVDTTDTSTNTNINTSTNTNTDTNTNTNTNTNKDASGTDLFTNPNLSPGAGGKGAETAATTAIQEEIKRLTDQIASMTANAAAEAAKPKAIGVKTVRKTGGVVETVEVMSDGSQGKVIDSYTDFGAKDSVMKMFENTGLGANFIKSLSDTIDKVYQENIMPTDQQILNSVYTSDAYKQRFAANEEIRKRMANGEGRPGDKLLTPYEYIQTEQTYRDIMTEAGLPTGFYDNQDDFTKLISNSISASELTSRVNIAKQALQNADQATVDALKNYYGWTTSDLTAYLLDSEKAFNLVDSRFKYTTEQAKEIYGSAEIGGAAQRAGGSLNAGGMADKAFAEEIYKSGKAGSAEQAFQSAARDRGDYSRLLGLAGQTAGEQDLAREQLGLAGGTDVALNTRKLASQERARFKQQSAISNTSLLKGRKQKSDV
jgi:hypothetical protein